MAVIDGTGGDDTLSGSGHKDRIDGLEGDDVLIGLGGDDLLTGGDGRDVLSGGEGRDTLIGGEEKDILDGGGGDDLLIDDDWGGDDLFGGDGDDTLSVSRAEYYYRHDLELHGDDGADRLSFTFTGPATGRPYVGVVVLDGGAGDDVLRASRYEARFDQSGLFGGDGDDRLGAKHLTREDLSGGLGDDILRTYKSTFTALDGGDGDDTLIADRASGGALSGGEGSDSFVVTGRSQDLSVYAGLGDKLITVDDLALDQFKVIFGVGHAEMTVVGTRAHQKLGDMYLQGFTPGDGGDRLLLGDYLPTILIGWDGTTDPFAAGYLRIETDRHGLGAFLEVDVDASGAEFHWKTLARSPDNIAAELTAYNFGGYDPDLTPT